MYSRWIKKVVEGRGTIGKDYFINEKKMIDPKWGTNGDNRGRKIKEYLISVPYAFALCTMSEYTKGIKYRDLILPFLDKRYDKG